MHQPALPPQARLRPWYGAGEVVRDIARPLPPARIPPLDPSEERETLGAVGQPETPQASSAFEPLRVGPRAGLPRLSEAALVRAHGRCSCASQAQERHTLAEWDEIETRQRAFAADAAAVEAEGREIAQLEGEPR